MVAASLASLLAAAAETVDDATGGKLPPPLRKANSSLKVLVCKYKVSCLSDDVFLF